MTNDPPDITNSLAEAGEIELGEDILGIRGLVEIPTGWEWLIYFLSAAVLIALAVFIVKKLMKRMTVIKPPPIPYVAPHALARRRLEAALRLIEDPYRFCSAVSDAVRGYLEGRFSIHAPDRTTDEFLEEARASSNLTPAQQDTLAGFLNQCDLAKFARDEPTRSDLERLYQGALNLVEETMLKPVPPPTASAKPMEVTS